MAKPERRAVALGEQGEGQALAVAGQQTRHFRRTAGRIGRAIVCLHVGQQAGEGGLIGRNGAPDDDGRGGHAATLERFPAEWNHVRRTARRQVLRV